MQPAPIAPCLTISTPVGPVCVRGDESGVTHVEFATSMLSVEGGRRAQAVLRGAADELLEYFRGARRNFTFPLKPRGTPFQHRVWAALRAIPYGTRVSYRDIAERLGDVKGVRAIGGANGANPIAIVVPCHRVIASDGSLHGYGGGLERKQWLLDHESRHAGVVEPLLMGAI